MTVRWITTGGWLALIAAVLTLPQSVLAHVTLQTSQPLRPGASFSNITLNVPNERHVDNTKVTLEIPDAFLKAGGRLNRLIYPAGWTVTLEKKDKPGDVYSQEKEQRDKRDAERQSAATEHGTALSEKDPEEQQAMDEMRKKWITKVIFEGGTIPPDGFQQFQLSFQMPDEPGRYRFAAVQTYADGKEVSWSELVEGAEHPAATLNVLSLSMISSLAEPTRLSALALLLSCIALFMGARATKKVVAEPSRSAGGQLASVPGHGD
jgi:uncharacterized protein YcnI